MTAQSSSTLQTAIRSGSDPDAISERLTGVLALGFVPDEHPATRLAVIGEFVKALSPLPWWAVQRAFDAWVRQHNRRPSPAEIVILAEAEIKPIADELARRRAEEKARQEQAAAERRDRVSAERAAEIVAELGFDPYRSDLLRRFPKASTMAEAEAMAAKDQAQAQPPDWDLRAPDDDPRMVALRQARAAAKAGGML